MQLIGAIIGFIVFLAVWYSRLKMVGGAAKDAAKLANDMANLPRKLQFRRRAGQTGLRGIEDPREAGAVMLRLVGLAYGGKAPSHKQVTVMRQEAQRVFELDEQEAAALIDHAGWLVRDVDAPRGLMSAMTKVVISAPIIGPRDLVDLDEMLVAVSEADEIPVEEQLALLQAFRDRAGLQA